MTHAATIYALMAIWHRHGEEWRVSIDIPHTGLATAHPTQSPVRVSAALGALASLASVVDAAALAEVTPAPAIAALLRRLATAIRARAAPAAEWLAGAGEARRFLIDLEEVERHKAEHPEFPAAGSPGGAVPAAPVTPPPLTAVPDEPGPPRPASPQAEAPSPPPPASPSRKPYLSASQIETYLQCPRRWAYRYVRGIRSPGSGATAQGKAWHAALEACYREMMAGRQPLSLAEEQDVFRARLAADLDRGLAADLEDPDCVRLRPGEGREELLAEGLEMVRVHREQIMPRVGTPIAVERKIVVDLGPAFPFDLLGYIDLVARDDDGRCGGDADGVYIRDNKSRSAKRGAPKQADLDRDVQLTTYALLWRAETQTVEAGLALDCVIKPPPRGGEVKAHIATTWRTTADIQWLLGLVEQMARAIYAEAYPPCHGGSQVWWCTEKWCDHWDACMRRQDWPGAGERLPGLALPAATTATTTGGAS